MIIFPSIDIRNGQCVRLYKGSFEKITVFNSSPYDQALEFKKIGFKYLHLVDLDGALDGFSRNNKIILKIINNLSFKIQLGGGVRNLKQISYWINCGVDKIVLGTMAVNNKKELKKACKLYPNKIAVAIDVKGSFLSIKGWVQKTKIKVLDFVSELEDIGVSRIIYTDINRDGTKKGVNISKLKEIIRLTNIPIVASGGVSSIVDIKNLFKIQDVQGVVIGKAIYDGSINLKELKKLDQ
jgi:phosphoribosylformimino-5-aminoimidazole carboxamide ribotide isomerase